MFWTIKLYIHAKLIFFKTELIIYMKINLALNYQQRWIYHKTLQTKPNQTKQVDTGVLQWESKTNEGELFTG